MAIAGRSRAGALHDLEPERQEDDQRRETEDGEERRDHRDGERSIAEEIQRDHRILGSSLDDDERHQEDEAHGEPAEDVAVGPGAGFGQGQGDQDRHDRADERGHAQDVQREAGVLGADSRQQTSDQVQGDQPDRNVDEEDPVPADVVRQDAAEEGSDKEGDAEDGTEETLVFASLGRSEEISDDCQRDREEGAGTEALDATEQDQLLHGLAEAGQNRSDQEQHDSDEQHRLAPEVVGQLAIDRDRGGAGH